MDLLLELLLEQLLELLLVLLLLLLLGISYHRHGKIMMAVHSGASKYFSLKVLASVWASFGPVSDRLRMLSNRCG